MRIIRIVAPWLLLLTFSCSIACGQGAPVSVDVFAEVGGSFLTNTKLPVACPAVCGPSGCAACPAPSISNAARVFTGARLRAGHDAVEASYSYSPNQVAAYNRLNLVSINYVRYLLLLPKVQPFATVGLGASRLSGPSGFPGGFHFAVNFGGGADIALQHHLALRLELRDYVGGLPGSFIGTSHDIVPSAGIVFKFW